MATKIRPKSDRTYRKLPDSLRDVPLCAVLCHTLVSPVLDAAVTVCSVSFATTRTSHQTAPWHVCSLTILAPSSIQSPLGGASSFAAGWMHTAHSTPVPYDNHSCAHRLSATWLPM